MKITVKRPGDLQSALEEYLEMIFDEMEDVIENLEPLAEVIWVLKQLPGEKKNAICWQERLDNILDHS